MGLRKSPGEVVVASSGFSVCLLRRRIHGSVHWSGDHSTCKLCFTSKYVTPLFLKLFSQVQPPTQLSPELPFFATCLEFSAQPPMSAVCFRAPCACLCWCYRCGVCVSTCAGVCGVCGCLRLCLCVCLLACLVARLSAQSLPFEVFCSFANFGTLVGEKSGKCDRGASK